MKKKRNFSRKYGKMNLKKNPPGKGCMCRKPYKTHMILHILQKRQQTEQKQNKAASKQETEPNQENKRLKKWKGIIRGMGSHVRINALRYFNILNLNR